MILIENWEFGVLDIYNHNLPGKLEEYFQFVEENHHIIEGDICEVGVFNGHSLLSMALFLKKIGSSKKVWGFDSFSGFPAYHKNDDLNKFDELLENGIITNEFFEKVKRNIQHRSLMLENNVDPSSISTSGNFSSSSINMLKKKIDYLQLDNIELVEGNFEDTMKNQNFPHAKFSTILMDCDLYLSHRYSLPFVWGKLVHGGYMFLDEYYSLKFPGAKIAIDEFFGFNNNKPQMHKKKTKDFERWYIKKIY